MPHPPRRPSEPPERTRSTAPLSGNRSNWYIRGTRSACPFRNEAHDHRAARVPAAANVELDGRFATGRPRSLETARCTRASPHWTTISRQRNRVRRWRRPMRTGVPTSGARPRRQVRSRHVTDRPSAAKAGCGGAHRRERTAIAALQHAAKISRDIAGAAEGRVVVGHGGYRSIASIAIIMKAGGPSAWLSCVFRLHADILSSDVSASARAEPKRRARSQRTTPSAASA